MVLHPAVLDLPYSLVEWLTMLIVTHELGFAREVASDVVFMDKGEIVEQGPPRQVLVSPQQPRTRDFIAAVLK